MSLHPTELDRRDWVILVTFLHHVIHQSEYRNTLSYHPKNIYDIMNDVIEEEGDIEWNKDELNKMVTSVNVSLDNNRVRDYLKSLTIEFAYKDDAFDDDKVNLSLYAYEEGAILYFAQMGATHLKDLYLIRHTPLKEKFEKFFKKVTYDYSG